MNNKMVAGLRLGNTLIILGIAVGLLASVASPMLTTSVEGSALASNSNQEAADRINDAKTALKNGDTEGAQKHLDAAHAALGCSPWDPRCATE
jgi:hypothetical protein